MRFTPCLLTPTALLYVAIAVGACGDSKFVTDAGVDMSTVIPPFIGGPCVEAADCLMDGGFGPSVTACIPVADGYCTLAGCTDPGFICPGASQCVPTRPPGWGFCLNPCVEQADCRPGFECFESITGFHACRAIPDDAGTGGSAGG